MIDAGQLWDFDDPAASERRFRRAASTTQGPDRLVLLTQLARALGLQERYDEAHALLDGLSAAQPEEEVRVALERGRLLRSAGSTQESRPLFATAERVAAETGLDTLRVDALHMLALVSRPDEQLALNEHALSVARESGDPRARDWEASLLNNIGMVHADGGDFAAALTSFDQALVASQRRGDLARIRVARWMVAWALRNLGQRRKALAMQRALRAELEADGQVDEYVDEEIALLEGPEEPETD